jgi:tetratricopeptide (TPR) repeat protein
MAALSEIEKLKARFDENPEGRYFAPLADAYRKTGRLDEAIELIQQGLTRHPDYLSAHIVLGRCYLGKKDDPAAKNTFEGVLALDSENIIALKSLAEIGERSGDTIAARRWLDQLLQVDPTNMDAESDLKRLGGPLAEGEDTAAGVEAAAEPVPPRSITEAETAPMPAIDIEPTSVEPPLEPVAAASDGLGLETTAHIPDDVPIVAEEQTDWAHLEHTGMPRERLSGAIAFMGAEGPESISMDLPLELEPPATAELEPGFEPTSAGAVPVPESSVDLPLIMPEDVTPAEELARPSMKQLATVSPEPLPAAGGAEPAAPLLTETMAELYLKQGFRAEAADVYRRLLAQQPGDAHLTARLAAVAAPAPSFSAIALGQEPLGSWLRRVARSSLSSPAPAEPPPAPPAGEPTPMDQAFAEPEPEPVPVEPPGEPARPASDAFTLDRVFGAEAPAETPAAPAAPAPPGASFDEFFGAAPAPTARPADAAPAGQPGPPPEGDDLSSFSTWLHGLKR